MINRSMLLALSHDESEAIEEVFWRKKMKLRAEASDTLQNLSKMEISAYDLIGVGGLGKKLQHVERAEARLSYLNQNFDTGGVNPDDRPKRRYHRSKISEPYKD